MIIVLLVITIPSSPSTHHDMRGHKDRPRDSAAGAADERVDFCTSFFPFLIYYGIIFVHISHSFPAAINGCPWKEMVVRANKEKVDGTRQ